MIRFFLVLSALAAIGGGVAYYISASFLPGIYNAQGKIDIEILKVLPAAIAAVVASVIAATTAVINVGLQLRTAKQLETHRIAEQLKANKKLAENAQKFAREMETDKNKYLDELEERKKVFTLELERRKQELGQQFSIEQLEIKRRLDRVSQSEETANSYRYLIGRIRFGEYHVEEISALSPKMADIANGLDRNGELYEAWRWFAQLGLYLCERASKLKSSSGMRRLWAEQNGRTGNAYGSEFVARAEKVRAMLAKHREEIIKETIT